MYPIFRYTVVPDKLYSGSFLFKWSGQTKIPCTDPLDDGQNMNLSPAFLKTLVIISSLRNVSNNVKNFSVLFFLIFILI